MLRLLFFLFPVLLFSQQIPTTAFTLQTTRGISNAEQSFDGDPTTSWFPGWSTNPGEFIVTFDGAYKLSKIRYLDGSGQPYLALFADNAPQAFKTIHLHQYLVWSEEKVDVTAKSLKIQLQGIEGDRCIPEIQFYGKKVGDQAQDTIVTPPSPTTGNMTGVGAKVSLCGFHWIPFDNLSGVFTKKRDFQMSSWTWTKDGFSPQPLAGAISPGVMGYDDYLTKAKEKGIDIIPCVNQTPAWFIDQPEPEQLYFVSDYDGQAEEFYDVKQGLAAYLGQPADVPAQYIAGGPYDPDMPPMKPGANPEDPASYVEYARFMFQYAARYGTKVWPDEMLKVNTIPAYNNAPVNQKKSGLGLLKYIEPWNEFVQFWKPELNKTPEGLAALLSAVYDGHCGTLGRGVGIADCGIKLLMPGLTSANLNEYKRMEAWCRKNRPDKSLPWDIVNFHWYSNAGNIAGRWPPTWNTGTPADCDAAWSDVEAFVKYVHSTGLEVWCTEFGYDSRGPSWQEAKAYGNYTGEQLQAMWLVRSYLMMFRAGVDQAFMFNGINEPGAGNGGLYQNSGLLYGRGDALPYSPKPAYHAVAALAKNLSGYTYVGDASPGGKVKLLRFRKGKQYAAYVWMATVDGSTAQIKLDGKTITVSETPQFILMRPGKVISDKKGPIRKFILGTSPRLLKPSK